MAKDTGLVDKKFTNTDVDLLFAKVKDKAERRITYAQFEKALELIAEKKGTDVDSIKTIVLGEGGLKFEGTKAEAVKFHDD